MKLYDLVDKKYLKPIDDCENMLKGWENVEIRENNEKLVSLKNIDNKIMISPQYFLNNISGAENDCKVRERLATKLVNIANKLPKGFNLIVWDSFRTIETQQALFDV